MNTLTRICCLLLLAVAPATNAQTTTSHTLRSNGRCRTYNLHLPADLPAGAPLVIVLHGYGKSADPARFGMNAVADRHGFAVCYPQGEKDTRGKSGWCVGYPSQTNMNIRDEIRFFRKLIRHLQKRYDLSRRNVFCTGMSNGGDMCYALAARSEKLFAAYGSVAGFLSVKDHARKPIPHPVPFLEIHGTADRTTRWDGDLKNRDGWGAYLPVPLAVGYLAAANRCTEYRSEQLPLQTSDSLRVIAHRYTGGRDGCEVWLYETVGGEHSWTQTGVDTGEAVWNFFSRQVK